MAQKKSPPTRRTPSRGAKTPAKQSVPAKATAKPSKKTAAKSNTKPSTKTSVAKKKTTSPRAINKVSGNAVVPQTVSTPAATAVGVRRTTTLLKPSSIQASFATLGIRHPRTRTSRFIIYSAAMLWVLFQLWSVLPFQFDLIVWVNSLGIEYRFGDMTRVLTLNALNDIQIRSVHLGFAVFLAFLVFPAARYSPRGIIPFADIIFAMIAAFCACYLSLFFEEIAASDGMLNQRDVMAASFGLLLLLEAGRRAIGMPMVALAGVCLLYGMFGGQWYVSGYVPDASVNFAQILHQQWLTDQGVFGLPLGVASSFVFMFVLFGALLERSGLYAFFLSIAYALSYRLRCATAKFSVLASGMVGVVSSSSVANTVITGSASIPLMRKDGIEANNAAAIAVISATYGQLIPPVMGAAAFILLEFAGISFEQLVVYLTLPSLLTYLLLLTLVHSESHRNRAVRDEFQPHDYTRYPLVGGVVLALSFVLVLTAFYSLVSLVGSVFSDDSHASAVVVVFALLYVALVWGSCRTEHVLNDIPDWAKIRAVPLSQVMLAGAYQLVPLMVLLWCLVDLHYAPGLAALCGCIAAALVLVTRHPLRAFFMKRRTIKADITLALINLVRAMIHGARTMIGLSVATAVAGIITGTLIITGWQQELTQMLSLWMGHSLVLVVVVTALIAFVLALCLPTTANFIVLATVTAGAIQIVAANSGVALPAIVIFIYLFYLAILADVVPPLGLASSAAAALSGGDPTKIALKAMRYGMYVLIVPVVLIFNHDLMWYHVDTIPERLWVVVYAIIGMIALVAGLRRYAIVSAGIVESVCMALAGLSILIPAHISQLILPNYANVDVSQVYHTLETMPESQHVRLTFRGEGAGARVIKADVAAQSGQSGAAALDVFGVSLHEVKGRYVVTDVAFNSQAESLGVEFDYVLSAVEVSRPPLAPSKVQFIAMVLLAGVLSLQANRYRKARALQRLRPAS